MTTRKRFKQQIPITTHEFNNLAELLEFVKNKKIGSVKVNTTVLNYIFPVEQFIWNLEIANNTDIKSVVTIPWDSADTYTNIIVDWM